MRGLSREGQLVTADELRDLVRVFFPSGSVPEALEAIAELEHSRDDLLFRCFTSLATDEPANRHPLAVLRHNRATVLSEELRAMFDSRELRRPGER